MSPTQWPRQTAGTQAANGTESVKVGAWVKPSEGGDVTPANDPAKAPVPVDAAAPNQQAAALVAALSAVIPGLQGGLPGAGSATNPTGEAALDPTVAQKNNDFLNTAFTQAAIGLGDLRGGLDPDNPLAARGDVARIDKPWETALLDRLKTT